METNPYSPPNSDVEIVPASNPGYYVVSIRKFALLFFMTLGIYSVYWFYRNWKAYQASTGEKIWPIPRAIFNIFFAHALFAKVDGTLNQHDRSFNWSPRALATGYVVLSIISNILDRLSMKEIGSPATDALSFLVLPAIYFTLATPQKAINIAVGDPEGEANSHLSGANFAWMGFGALLWIVSAIGLLMVLGVLPEGFLAE